MAQKDGPRSGSVVSAFFLIGFGIFLLFLNLVPGVSFWWTLVRYWPVILILLGVGGLWDYFWSRSHPEDTRKIGASAAWVVLFVVFGILMFHTRGLARGSGQSSTFQVQHEKKSVELQGAKSVTAHLQMPAGELDVHGGSANLLDASFDYSDNEEQPQVSYTASGDSGNLEITQQHKQDEIHIGKTRNHWDLQFAKNVPLDLGLTMGAGQGNLNLRDVELSRLSISIGAGQLDVNLTGDRKADLSVDIQGGVGQATIHLPKKVGVVVHAHGGIGSIDVQGLQKDGDEYHNDAYGKSPVTLDVTVNGGVGQIQLQTED